MDDFVAFNFATKRLSTIRELGVIIGDGDGNGNAVVRSFIERFRPLAVDDLRAQTRTRLPMYSVRDHRVEP